MHNNTLVLICNVIHNVHVNNEFSYLNNVYFEGNKILFLKGHIMNRILQLWSFHLKFMKLTEGSFYKFHLK